MSDAGLLANLVDSARSVAVAVLPLLVLFLIFQVFFLGLPRKEVSRILTGALIAAFGLFLFLLGVSIGFLPFGRAIGESAGALPRQLLLPFGMVLGFLTTWGEPAVRVLAGQVEEASAGSIRGWLVLYAICIGVAIATGLGLHRIGYGVPLLWILIPGYVLVIAMIWTSEASFVSIAIDAGGVATGPRANTFLLALAFGAASAIGGREPLVHGLGLVSLIALAPVLCVLLLGFVVRRRAVKES